MYYFMKRNTGAPCLTFDTVKDKLGDNRGCDTPVTCYFVAGSQAARTHINNIVLLKMSNLRKINTADNEEDEDSDDEEELPVITSALINHNGSVNRIRTTAVDNTHLAASWSELGQVNVWDMSAMLEAVDDANAMADFQNTQHTPLYSFNGHGVEGFALDWAPSMPGTLASGDCSKFIFIWKPEEGGKWAVGSRPYTAHTASVEDIQWSPNEPHVFASCSVDKR
ncbi:UNVERIFIED_CONTAM: hypothetical protein GTU68_017815 [Idotea baltica]|nr:hypothetical protein [Idotea baltica]